MFDSTDCIREWELVWYRNGDFTESSELLLASLFDGDVYTKMLDRTIYDYTTEFSMFNYYDVVQIILFMMENNLVGKPLDEILTLMKVMEEHT